MIELPADGVDDEAWLRLSGGRDLYVGEAAVSLMPWKPATELPPSELVGSMIELPTICVKHVVYYPSALAVEAQFGRFYAFTTACECHIVYLIETESDGAHCQADGSPLDIHSRYDMLQGEELMFNDQGGSFLCKRLHHD